MDILWKLHVHESEEAEATEKPIEPAKSDARAAAGKGGVPAVAVPEPVVLEPQDWRPWQHIHPHVKGTFTAQYNTWGKYCVKLFWLVSLEKSELSVCSVTHFAFYKYNFLCRSNLVTSIEAMPNF